MKNVENWPSPDKEKLFGYLSGNSFHSERHKLLYVATPKVACTSLKWWFASLSGLSKEDISNTDSKESDPDLVIHDTFHKLAPSVTGLLPQNLINPLTSDLYFRFCVVRNPYTRIFSAWQSKLLLREPLQSHSYEHCDFYNRSINNMEDIALAYEGFLEHLLSLDEVHLDAHWKPQFSLLRPDLISYSKVTKLENVNDLIPELIRHVGTSISSPFSNRPKNESLIPYSRNFVTDRSTAIIQELYAKDFEVFEYNLTPVTGREDFSTAELNVAIRAIELIRGRHSRLSQISIRSSSRISELTHDVERRGGQVADLEKAVLGVRSELNELQNILTAVYKSRSWRITRPFRFALKLLINRRQIKSRLLGAVKKITNSLRQYGVLITIKKVIDRYKMRGAFLRYSSVPCLSDNTLASSVNSIKDQSPRNRTLISMVKNEKSIIETFAAHVLAMFDRVIFVDHQSTDGTSEYLKSLAAKHPEVEYFLFNEAGYYQSEVMTWVVKNMVGSDYNGWVFFLDADEYLPFSSRTKFDEKLASYGSFPLISMPWLNLVPMDMEAGQVKSGVFLKPSKTATHHKIAFQPSLIPVDEYVIAQGNHALLIGDSCQQLFPAEEAFSIYHIPIRTKQQLRDKIQLGVESYKKMGVDRANNLGFHWDEISRLIDNKGLTDDLMADMVIRYGEQMVPPYGKSISSMIQDGHTEFTLDICTIEQILRFNEVNLKHDVGSDIFALNDRQEKVGSRRNLPIVLDAERQVLKFKTD